MKKKHYLYIMLAALLLLLAACADEPSANKPSGGAFDSKTVVVNNYKPGEKDLATPTPTQSALPTPTDGIAPTQGGNDPGNNDHVKGTFSASDMKITLDGVFLQPGMDFKPYIDSMATAPRIEEGMACIDDGYDTNYYYGELYAVYTLAGGSKQLIYDIYVTGKGYSDSCGVKVGTTTRAEVNAIYGTPTKVNPAADKYEISNEEYMSFEYEDDIVTAIDICKMNVK